MERENERNDERQRCRERERERAEHFLIILIEMILGKTIIRFFFNNSL